MNTRLALVAALPLLLLLFACDSSTGPGDGSSGFDLAGAFDGSGAEIEPDENGTRLRFDDLDFGGRESSTLTEADKATLDRFAAVFEGVSGARYRIESHTDSRGANDDNLRLTRDRARAVRDYLVEVVGGPGPYIEWSGLGESTPLDPGSNQLAWARNDRVEIVVDEGDGRSTRFVLQARRLDVEFDCDADVEPGVLQPGDFYVTVSIRVSNSSGFHVMDEVVGELVTASDGESFELAISASAVILPVETDIVEIYVGFDEFDGGSSYGFRRSALYQFGYSPELDCWGRWNEAACGVTNEGILEVEAGSVGGPPCATSLEWSLRLEEAQP